MTGDDVEIVTGWGRNPASAAYVVRPTDADELAVAAKAAGPRGVIARGLGRAYGDSAMNAGGLVIDSTGVSGLLELDRAAGTARVLAGTSLDTLLRRIVPEGWFVPVTPGTRHITVGGAIAADVHGKDHHATGSFGTHVRSLVLALPDGTRRTLSPTADPDAFWATCGGLGLTGTIIEATIGVHPIETAVVRVDTNRVPDLDTLLALLAEGGRRYRYSVAWVDFLARGRSLGRSVLTQGDFARRDELPGDRGARGRAPRDPLAYAPAPPVPTPRSVPGGMLNRASIRAFNELWYHRHPRRGRGELWSISRFFYPLDRVDGWNRMYGPRGFLQWQCLLPYGAEGVLREVVEALAEHRAPSFLSVLKYFGAADPAPLSFPGPGWTLALDVPATDPTLGPLFDRLDERVVEAGGRLYLAKDSRMRPELLPAMYPRL
ncbi:MAG TPA: FAD-binding oxidoreductase, partial [Acidimicrobiales bacterium]|nr:FAD-binding oxidoreductase [Acidimicrobiales bacterium]